MANVKYRFTSDPTFHNDYIGSIFFEHGVCEFDENDSEKLRYLENLKVINGWVFEKIEDKPETTARMVMDTVQEKVDEHLIENPDILHAGPLGKPESRGESPAPETTKKRKSKKKKKRKRATAKPKDKPGVMSLQEAGKLTLKTLAPSIVKPEKRVDLTEEKADDVPQDSDISISNFHEYETEEKVEQTENQPEHDDKGRSGDAREDDTVSKTDS